MKITRNTNTVFRCPTGLLVNNITVGILRGGMRKKGIHLTRKQTATLTRELKSFKKRHPDWKLAEITDKNGDNITIEL